MLSIVLLNVQLAFEFNELWKTAKLFYAKTINYDNIYSGKNILYKHKYL